MNVGNYWVPKELKSIQVERYSNRKRPPIPFVPLKIPDEPSRTVKIKIGKRTEEYQQQEEGGTPEGCRSFICTVDYTAEAHNARDDLDILDVTKL